MNWMFWIFENNNTHKVTANFCSKEFHVFHSQKNIPASSEEHCTLYALTSVLVPHTVLDGQPVSMPGFWDARPVSTDYPGGQLSMDFYLPGVSSVAWLFSPWFHGCTHKRNIYWCSRAYVSIFQRFVQSAITGTSSNHSGNQS